MIPETGTRRRFKRWVMEDLWGWKCAHGHAHMVDKLYDTAYDLQRQDECAECVENYLRVKRKAVFKYLRETRVKFNKVVC